MPGLPATPFGVLAVTGYDEALAVYKNPAFSSCVSVAGPFSGMPFGPGESDDVTELIEQHRDAVPMAEHITSQDAPLHTRTRGLFEPADHAQAPQGERGVHVAPRRRAARHVHRTRPV